MKLTTQEPRWGRYQLGFKAVSHLVMMSFSLPAPPLLAYRHGRFKAETEI